MEKVTSKGQMTFREIYMALDKKEFKERMMRLTGCSLSSVNCWIAGAFQPNPTAKMVIAGKSHSNCPPSSHLK